MEKNYPWKLEEKTKDGQRSIGEYPVKRQLVAAMMAMKAPGSPIYAVGHRTYVITRP